MKLNESIFEQLTEKSKVSLDEIVYSADNPVRIVGAEALGIQTFIHRYFDQFVKELNSLGIVI